MASDHDGSTTGRCGLTRRALLGRLGIAAVALPLATLTACASAGPGSDRKAGPNFLIVMLDDLGRGELGCYGQQRIKTPVMDALAAEGVRFDQAYAAPTCAPSRFSLFTGLDMAHARVKNNRDGGKGMVATDVTLPGVLRDRGYTTGLIGKWGLGPEEADQPSHPNNQGFDSFFGCITQGQAHDYWPTYLWRDDKQVRYPENDGARATYSPDLFVEESLAFLDRAARRDAPFFLTVSLTPPHGPSEIPSDAPYGDEPWPQGERNHAAQVTYVDTQIGRLLGSLDSLGLADDTMVVVLSDNGPHAASVFDGVGSDLKHRARFFNSMGPLRGIKGGLYEGGVRIPMIARLPRGLLGPRAAAGAAIDTPLAVWDVFATFASMARASTESATSSISFLPAMRGEDQPEHDYLYFESVTGKRALRAVRFGDWKAFRQGIRPTRLYQLSTDPGERHDVAAEFPSVTRRAEAMIKAAPEARADVGW